MKDHLSCRLNEVQMSLRCLIANHVIYFLLPCLLVGRTYGGDTSYACVPGLGIAGWTIPKGDIYVEVGETLEIFCLISQDFARNRSVTSENLVFYNGSTPINPDFVTKVNDTSIKLKIDGTSMAKTMYYCKLSKKSNRYGDVYTPNNINTKAFSASKFDYSQDEMLCLNSVSIGTKPKEVFNFTCISYNWEYLNVSWTAPDNNVPTNYTVYYQTPKRGGRGSVYNCPNSDDYKESKCMWSMSTDPLYRKTLEYLSFTVKGTNHFGNSSQQFKIHHFAHILPHPPQKLTMVNKTVSSVYLSWSIGHLHILEKGLVYKIGHARNSTWNYKIYEGNEVNAKGDRVGVNVTGLEYANTQYDFRVSSKSTIATSEEFWSRPASLVVRTASCPPYTSPKTDVGSFEIVQETAASRDVLIYWKDLPDTERNGDDFRYNITGFAENEETATATATATALKPDLVTRSYARFNDLDFNGYRFEIRSVNARGAAEYATRVYVPKKTEIVAEPTVFTKIDYADGVYELSWKCAENARNKVVNFTTFWCESAKDRPYQCNGFLDWTHLPADTTKHNFTINSTSSYQFAISANSETSSSGMVWSSCTAIHNKLNKMKNVGVGKIGADFIDVRWKLECSERIDSIKGYHVVYCVTSSSPIDNANDNDNDNANANATCTEKEKTLKVFGDVTTMHANITNLKPFTGYKVQVAIFVKDGRVGPLSDEIVERTMEKAPEVRGLKIEPSRITNNSVHIRWEPPSVVNGVLRYYRIRYNEKEVSTGPAATEITLANLTSYTSYDIKVSACTSLCSEMEPIVIVTKTGIPGVVGNLATDKINSSYVAVTWNQPLLLAGPNPVYDVKVLFDQTDKNSTVLELQTAHTRAEIAIPNCHGKSTSRSSYTFKVRAKNIDAADPSAEYVGDWSQAYTINCMPDEIPTLLQITIFLALFVTLVCSVIFFGKRGLTKCQQMQDFNVTLPSKFIDPLYHNDSKHRQDYHINIGSWCDDNAECDHLNSKSALDLDQSSVDCIDMDLDTDRETDRSSSGCYTG